eukprot:c13053_g1_i2.p1 GENE.c13053_g1_i2~~c13053_g1_i2.p1  ORF type:complete len:511 (-),score=140.47 c13053_g1_i2:94-1626(-)
MPGDRGHWLLGLTTESGKHMHRIHDYAIERFGNHKTVLFRMATFFPFTRIDTVDPVIVKHFLKDRFDVWSKTPEEDDTNIASILFREFVGGGIFLAPHGPHSPDKGKVWLLSRKVASGIFTRNNFKDLMRDVFVEKAHEVVRMLKHTASQGKATDMQAVGFAFSMDSITKIFFGVDTGTIDGNVNEFAKAFDDAHKCILDYFFGNIGFHVLSALLPWPLVTLKGGPLLLHKIHRYFNPTSQLFSKSTAVLREYTDAIIRNKRADPSLPQQRDLLALFMNAQDDEGVSLSDPKYAQFLKDITFNFILAGRDTTACSIAWTMYILATEPDIQQRLCDEVDRVLGKGANGRAPSYDDVTPSAMPYLNGLVYESLRLYPPVPFDTKKAMCDDVLPGGFQVRKNTIIAWFPYAMGRDESRYPDAHQVKPERWIPFKVPDSYEFPVFQAGPRICLGMSMALLETKIFIAMLAQHLTFSLAEGEKEKITYALTFTLSVANSPDGSSHQLLVHPHLRE